jgi:hypothetical protein
MRRIICPGCRRQRLAADEDGEQCAECRKTKPQTFDKGTETGWAVLCPIHGRVYLTYEEYGSQVNRPNAGWTCPAMDSDPERFGLCGSPSEWDDLTYEEWEENRDGVGRDADDFGDTT